MSIIKHMKNLLRIIISIFTSIGMAAICGLVVILLYTNAKLPSVNVLEDIKLQVPLRIYTADGKLIGEFGEKRRSPIKIDEVPEKLKQAILATEDRRFYEHKGVDVRGMMRATMNLLVSGTKSQGASTITMQVARNFFLSRKKTFWRKLNEILLAVKIEKELPKDKILELYLNKIYFGKRAYGVQSAAQVYYGLNVNQLSLAQMAMIAGLPQAPSSINPINNPDAALKRRSHVLKRMYHYGFINKKEYTQAVNAPIKTTYHGTTVEMEAPFVAEMARQELLEKYGPNAYTDGLMAYTTVNSNLQKMANAAIQEGLLEYDKRHGYRGPIQRLSKTKGTLDIHAWAEQLCRLPKTNTLMPVAVLSVHADSVQALLANQKKITIPFSSMQWAQKRLSAEERGPQPNSPFDVVRPGDVVYVESRDNGWLFSQYPDVEGSLVSLHPKNGAILAMVGGFNFQTSNFNRATQSTRQAGSNFKPFVYAAALENGFTAATIVNDAPIVYKNIAADEIWRPQNDNHHFYGPTRLRVGLTKSRNLVSIRLLQALGIGKALDIIQRFGFKQENLPRSLSLALGTTSTSPVEIATGYAAFANGGYKINAHILQRIYDSQNNVIYTANPPSACPECEELAQEGIDPTPHEANAIDKLIDYSLQAETKTPAERILEPQTSYIMTSILQDAIQTGTGRKAVELNRPELAGKTGSTNNHLDAWYTGYNQSLVTSVWVGYDEPRTLDEYGAQVALPIWMKFMGAALAGVPEEKLSQPRGIVTVKIDPRTGLLAYPGQPNAIFEVFRQETAPSQTASAAESHHNAITPSGANGETLF